LRPDVETYASYGEMLIAQAQGQVTPEAHDALTKALELDREEPRSRFYLGLEQSQQNNPRDAIAIWRDLTNTAPQDAPWQAMVQRQMAQVAQNAGIPPMSVEPRHPLSPAAAPTATASAPPPAVAPTPTMDQRFTPEQRQMVEGMVGGLAARLEQNPNDFKGWMLLGRSYSVMEKWDDAAKAYDKAVALEPTNAEPKLQLMGVLMATVNPDAPEPMPARVVTVANDILKIHSAQADALFALGLARAKAGDKAGARDFWQRAEKSAGPELKDSIAQRMKALN
jgi:cytochrome c-type biogenesis protein CcmH